MKKLATLLMLLCVGIFAIAGCEEPKKDADKGAAATGGAVIEEIEEEIEETIVPKGSDAKAEDKADTSGDELKLDKAPSDKN